MSALPSRRALALGAALIGGAALLTPLGIASLRRSEAERGEPPAGSAAATPAPAGAATAPADGGALLADGEAGWMADGGAGSMAHGGGDAGPALFEKPVWSAASRAASYGGLSSDACDRELKRRGIPHAPAPRGAPLVDRPVRITGPLHGVTFHGDGVAKPRSTSVFDIADCRLVLALDDLAAFLATRGIAEVVHVSMHRPAPAGAVAPKTVAPKKAPANAPKKAPAKAKPGKKAAKGAGKGAKPGARAPKKPAAAPARPSQHALGLAIDVAALVKADGARLDVKADWHGAIGAPPCGPGSEPKEATPQALELREIICAVFTSGLFNVVLTPNANEAHADHFHFDIKRDAHYFLLE
ncbi:extensin family protein [Sorangium sp. So ce119]|uniref:extensin family protein n=1 Tax=Sorangium sp. So ce119 TaxID=3133279 RepID=UPI003F631922